VLSILCKDEAYVIFMEILNNIVQQEAKTWIYGSKLIPTFGAALLLGKIQ
jgi:hypothetical protein